MYVYTYMLRLTIKLVENNSELDFKRYARTLRGSVWVEAHVDTRICLQTIVRRVHPTL